MRLSHSRNFANHQDEWYEGLWREFTTTSLIIFPSFHPVFVQLFLIYSFGLSYQSVPQHAGGSTCFYTSMRKAWGFLDSSFFLLSLYLTYHVLSYHLLFVFIFWQLILSSLFPCFSLSYNTTLIMVFIILKN